MKVSARKHSPNLGFTLIELLIVIAIIGILSAIAIPSFSTFTTNQRLSQAAKQVKQDLRSAQNRAINGIDGKAWGIRFASLNAQSYTVYTCNSLDTTQSPCVCDTPTDTTTIKSLLDGFVIDVSATSLFVFDEISGDICDSSGLLGVGASNSIDLSLDGSSPRTITVTAGGKIEEN